MISSPCRECPMKNQPKDKCYKNCEKLQAVQMLQVAKEPCYVYSGIDYVDESRYWINTGAIE
jgi:hypothetical protein